MTAKFTFFYIVEPPLYQFMAVTLLASIREYFPDPEIAAIGYCPEHRLHELHPSVLRAHELMNGEIRTFKTEGRWRDPYPHGNKILASLEPRDSKFSAFVDSDVMFLQPNMIENLAKAGHVSCSMAASMRWGSDDIWPPLYEAFDMPIPEERLHLMRQSRSPRIPYFSSGFVIFPEKGRKRFAKVWYETAQKLDALDIPNRRPYLDQISLPIAIQRAGLKWNVLPEEQHYILGGLSRGEPLPQDRKIYTIHYRKTKILNELGLDRNVRKLLKRHIGARVVQRLTPEFDSPEPAEPDLPNAPE